MWAQFAILLLSTVSLAQGYYCGDYPYKEGNCLCTDGSWCTPQLYPTICCDSTKMPSWFSGQWVLVDTTDPLNSINTSIPINISAPSIAIPWNDPEFKKISNVSWSGSNLNFDAANPNHAVVTVEKANTDLNYLTFSIDLSLNSKAPANITFSYSWVSPRRPNCKGNVTLIPYPNASQPAATRNFRSISL